MAVFPLFTIFVGLATQATWIEMATRMKLSGIDIPAPALAFLEHQQAILWIFFFVTVAAIALSATLMVKNRAATHWIGSARQMTILIFTSLISIFYLAFLVLTAALLIAPLFR
ncbi:MAG: hypothetical protein K6B46_04690 [Opitutales bacterium]|nr:hypothetical protein [Opitutales bacterium]